MNTFRLVTSTLALIASTSSAFAEIDMCKAARLPFEKTVRIDTMINRMFDVEVDASAQRPFLAGGGKSVIFESRATNIPALLPNDEPLPVGSLDGGYRQIYVMDLATRAVRIVSINDAGKPSNGDCTVNEGSLDHAGDVAVFECSGTNLLPDGEVDENGMDDIFAHFLNDVYGYQNGDTLRITRAFSEDFDKNDLGGADAKKIDDYGSEVASIAPFAPVVVFSSTAGNMVRDLAEPVSDVPNILNYAFNLNTGEMSLISATDDGEPALLMFTPAIDGDGDFIVSPSPSANLKECDDLAEFAAKRCENEKTITSLFSFDNSNAEEITRSRFGQPQRRTGFFCSPLIEAQLGQPSPLCGSLSPDLSYDGDYLVFDSTTPNFPDRALDFNRTVDVYAYHFSTDEFMLVSRVPGTDKAPRDFSDVEVISAFSDGPEIAGNGRWVIYRSTASELTQGLMDIGFFVADLDNLRQPAKMVSIPPTGGEPFSRNAGAAFNNDMPNMTAGGEIVAFSNPLLKDDPAEGEEQDPDRDVPGYLRCIR